MTLNTRFENHLMRAAEAVGELNKLKAEVLDIDLSHTTPIVRVHPVKGLHQRCNAWRHSLRHQHGQHTALMRGQLGRCLIEWEIQP